MKKLVDLKESDIDQVESMLNEGLPVRTISAELGIAAVTVGALKREYLDRIQKESVKVVREIRKEKKK